LDSAAKIKQVSIPKLFFHSIDDRIVPLKIGKKLFDAAGEPKKFVELIGDHNDGHIYSERKFISAIEEFVK